MEEDRLRGWISFSFIVQYFVRKREKKIEKMPFFNNYELVK